MLILTRKPGESLYIGDSVKVTIVEIKGHQIRVGIDAPSDLRIYREEIYLQILEENRQAAEASTASEASIEGLAAAWKERRFDQILDSKGAPAGKMSQRAVPSVAALTPHHAEPTVVVKRRKKDTP